MTTPRDAFLRGDFNRGLTLIGFHENLQKLGMFIFKHEIWLFNELIALKTKDGIRLTCSICLDWLKQEFKLDVGAITEVWKVNLE